MIEEVLENLQNREAFEEYLWSVASRLDCYEVASSFLGKLGYSEQELIGLSSLAAWDYGRTVYIARWSVAAGYLNEEEAWQYMRTAAENAAERYTDWREYIAAYVIGRAVGYGDNCMDIYPTLNYLLKNNESPLNKAQFK